MKVLVDTHCWLWFLMTPGKLSSEAVDALADVSNEVYVSAAVAWEIVIKHGLGKLPLPLPGAQYVSDVLPPLVTDHSRLRLSTPWLWPIFPRIIKIRSTVFSSRRLKLNSSPL